MYIGVLAITVCCFIFYARAENETCGLSKFFIAFNLVLCILITAASVHPRVQEGACSQVCCSAVLEIRRREKVAGESNYKRKARGWERGARVGESNTGMESAENKRRYGATAHEMLRFDCRAVYEERSQAVVERSQ